MRRPFAVLLLAGAAAWAQSSAKPEFEVASVRPSSPSGSVSVGCKGGPGTKDPELFTCQSISLTNLITLAYRLDFYRLSAPDWMTPMLRFDLSARIPPNTAREQFSLMMQNFLADRFKLVVHHENRESTQFNLVVAKNGPKFRAAADTPPPADGVDSAKPPVPFTRPTLDKDGYPAFTGRPMATFMAGKARLYQPKMTMQALANRISNQMKAPVSDATGLAGEYEIGLYWVPDGGLRAAASTANDGPTLPEALREQLGLQIESKKGSVDFVVVDHAEKVPTEN